MKKLLVFLFSTLLLALLFFQFTHSVHAVDCCIDKVCGVVAGTQCASGVKSCNGAIAEKLYTDEEGKQFYYHPDCFIVIVAPETVRITNFGKLFSGVVAFLLLVAFILAFFFLILGGISWLTSGGDKAAVEAARNKIIAAIVGLVIVAATWALFQLVGGAIGFNILGGFEVPRLF